ncbi:MAG: flippase-like domain-containing protein, partial [Planctomycetaceae bacterium]|nr:flippase-like domain-containing protein [Planctomycetaceae bacterium]
MHGADGLGVLRDRTLVTKSLLNTLAQWGLAGLQMTIALWSFGVEISPATGCLLVAVVAVGVTVPSAPGYLGVIQALFLLVVNEQTVGVTNASAVFGASVYYHMTQYVLVTFGGLFLLHREGLTVAQTQSVAATSDSPP